MHARAHTDTFPSPAHGRATCWLSISLWTLGFRGMATKSSIALTGERDNFRVALLIVLKWQEKRIILSWSRSDATLHACILTEFCLLNLSLPFQLMHFFFFLNQRKNKTNCSCCEQCQVTNSWLSYLWHTRFRVWWALTGCRQKGMLGTGCDTQCSECYPNFAWLELSIQPLCVFSIT